MGLFSNLASWLDEQDNTPRTLDDHDVSLFEEAASYRKAPSNIKQIERRLREKNFVRMRRLRKDFLWLQKQMKKMGLNPEDARWLL